MRHTISRSNEAHGRKESPYAARVTGEQRQMRHVGMGADEKVGQWPRLFAASMPVFLKGFSSMKRCIERQRQVGESREAVFQFPLRVKLHREFTENHGIVADRPGIRPMLELKTGPFKPLWVFGEDVGDDAGVHQNHAAPRVSRSQLAVLPLTLPPRSNAVRTRLPLAGPPALTTSTPSGWSTNSTS
jgi:hypothetical protein